MNEPLFISSNQNPKIKQIIHLRDRKERDKTDLFLIEGYRELLRAVEGKKNIHSLFICPELFLGVNEASLINLIQKQNTSIFQCSPSVFEKISYRDRPDGLLAIAKQTHLNLQDLKKILAKKSNPFILVAEAIEKPGNLGTILRSADAVGLDACILCDQCTDLYNPNVVRASVGTLFSVPVIESSSAEALQWLKENRITVLAATPSAEKSFHEVNLLGPIAIAVGAEQIGLSEKWMGAADLQVKIPMQGKADSLNVAMASTLLMYEVLRQREYNGRN